MILFFNSFVVESYGRLEKVFLFPPSTKSICCPVSLFMVCTIQWSLYSETRIVKYWQQWFFREWSFHTNIVVLDFTYVLTTFSIIPTARPNNEGMVYWNAFSLSRIDLIFIEHSWENGFLVSQIPSRFETKKIRITLIKQSVNAGINLDFVFLSCTQNIRNYKSCVLNCNLNKDLDLYVLI